MKTLAIPMACGAATCYSAPQKACRFLATRRFGTIDVCTLFNEELMENERGWLQRCKPCLEYESRGGTE